MASPSPSAKLPPRLQVELTNRCSLGCASCARHSWDEGANEGAEMSADTYTRLLPLLDSAIELTIGGYGDPTEASLLVPLVRAAKDAQCSVRMISGGSKLSPDLLSALVDAGLDRLVLSMDGLRDDTLRGLRGVPLRAWLKWIRRARQLREEGAGVRPIIQLNFVAQWANVDELPDLVSFCSDEGIAGIHAFHLKAYSNNIEDCLLTDPEAARPFFEQARQRSEDLGVFLHLPSLDGTEQACRQPFEHLFVRHDGSVRGCCSGLFEPSDFGLLAGRLEEGGEALWSAPELRRFRAASASGIQEDYPTPCRSCAFRFPMMASHDRPLSGASQSPRLAVLSTREARNAS